MAVSSPRDNPLLWPWWAAGRRADAPALAFGARRLSFSALEQELARLAGRLAGMDCGPVLGIALECRFTTALLCWAAPRAGLIPFPVNPALPVSSRDRLLRQAGAQCLLAAPGGAEHAGIRRLEPSMLVGEPSAVAEAAPAQAVQLILGTSGSGGDPKGVMHTGAGIAAAVEGFLRTWPLGPGDRWLACLPSFHIGGLAIFYRCWAAGAAVELHSGFSPGRLWGRIAEGGISHISLVPAMLAALLDQSGGQRPHPRLRMALIGGAALAPDLARCARSAGWPLCVGYGMTETAALCAADCSPQAGTLTGLVGRLLPGFRAVTASDGRLRLSGPALMAGYANPERRFGDGLERGWLDTGDLGAVDAGGQLRIQGRADELLVSGGELVHPAQVEDLLTACPGVSAVGVSGLPDPRWGELLAAWYQGDWEPERVDSWCRERLPGYLRPRRLRKVDFLPLTGSGKLDRGVLRRRMIETESQ